jgi:DNA-binding SARP family transcriptional activator
MMRAPAAVGGLRLNLLRGFELSRDGDALTLPMNAQRLVAFVALHDRPSPRLFVAGSLWTDSDEERSNASLRSALWRVGCVAADLLTTSKSHLSLAPGVMVDMRKTVSIARRLVDDPQEVGLDEIDARCLVGDLLTGWYDDWIIVERERLRQLTLHALELLCVRLSSIGKHAQAIESGMAAVLAEPLRESAHRALIQAHIREGNCCEALRQYRIYRDLVRQELSIEPSQLMEDLVAGLMA